MATLKITSVPPGEAPAWVREQWVGLELPLVAGSSAPHTLPTFGVLSHPKSRISWHLSKLFRRFQTETGYVVECLRAIEVLEKSSPDAAAWWRSNTPELLQPGQCFMFHVGVGHVALSGAA